MTLKKVNFDLTPFVESAVASLIDEGKAFSAFKVTLELRKMLPTFDIRHDDVKALSHEVIDATGQCSQSDTGHFIEYTPVKVPAAPISMFTTLGSSTPGLSAAVTSSFILDLAYLANKEILIIDMATGVYAYTGIDMDLYEKFYNSSSKGQFYNSQIKGHFKSCPVKIFK